MSGSVRFLVDEDFDNVILRGVRRRLPQLDIVRVQDVALSGLHDTLVLEWAGQEGRILLTHDISTMKPYACPYRERATNARRVRRQSFYSRWRCD